MKKVIHSFSDILKLQGLVLILFFVMIVLCLQLLFSSQDVGGFGHCSRVIFPFYMLVVFFPVILSTFFFYRVFYEKMPLKAILIFLIKNWLLTFIYLFLIYVLYTWSNPEFVYLLKYPGALSLAAGQEPPMLSPWATIHNIFYDIVFFGAQLAAIISLIIAIFFALIQLCVVSFWNLLHRLWKP